MRHLPFAVILALILLLPAVGQTAPSDAERLAEEKARAAAAREALQELTAEERSVHKDLARAESRIKQLQQRIKEEEHDLSDLRAAQKDVAASLEKMERKKSRSLQELERLLQNLWPVTLRRDILRGRTLPDWEQADREFVWMAEVYGRVEQGLQELRSQEQAIRKTLDEKETLANEARKRLALVNKDKDELLDERMRFRRELAAVRKQKTDKKEELDALMALLQELNYSIEQERKAQKEAERKKRLAQAKQPFKKLEGKLPWPVDGKVEVRFNPRGKDASRGIGFSSAENTPVHAVSWGRVVHNEVLRGLGRVVILLHGDDYYSLYAYLSSSDLEKGQQVAQGDVIGATGYYPAVKGPGMYFELRFHQKPINPRQWLIARK